VKQRDPLQLGIKIQVDVVAMQKLWLWADMADGEVSALGLVEDIRDENSGLISILRITDFLLLKQQCNAVETEMDPAAISQLMMDMEEAEMDSSKLRCWAHSHDTMSVFWSDVDHANISGLANGEWLLSLVVNKKRESMMRLDIFHPAHMFLPDVVWEVYYPLDDDLEGTCVAEFKAKVTERPTADVRVDTIRDIRQAHERGALTNEELEEELSWTGLDDEQPF
jgi:hypothetical protein